MGPAAKNTTAVCKPKKRPQVYPLNSKILRAVSLKLLSSSPISWFVHPFPFV